MVPADELFPRVFRDHAEPVVDERDSSLRVRDRHDGVLVEGGAELGIGLERRAHLVLTALGHHAARFGSAACPVQSLADRADQQTAKNQNHLPRAVGCGCDGKTVERWQQIVTCAEHCRARGHQSGPEASKVAADDDRNCEGNERRSLEVRAEEQLHLHREHREPHRRHIPKPRPAKPHSRPGTRTRFLRIAVDHAAGTPAGSSDVARSFGGILELLEGAAAESRKRVGILIELPA